MTTFKDLLKARRIIAIARGISKDSADGVADAMERGGVSILEVTLNTPGAIDIIANWRRLYDGRLQVGAGTVLTIDDARRAIDAGAQFLVTPHTDEALIAFASPTVPVVAGAFTPSEILRAWTAGAAVVKIFPVSTLGPAYIRDLRGPLGHIPMAAVGGVTDRNAAEFLRAGAIAVGIGGQLISNSLARAGDFDTLTNNARRFVKAIEAAVHEETEQ
ncbi:MAG: bifunctional 4-hydroxy-2-oxoglutarate aldolase/2-dehydro-3-deoxy-phosphogluconate aldolase [Capsulimonadaceae bacterium]|nr:bifunctional 4-hydroxy-2-oxoglutarate aldolase/2-dehydro-3-deoxy-phosphogluconate aldolase [Capsulimonadaceae bacterium]